jgi:hypothetical protein
VTRLAVGKFDHELASVLCDVSTQCQIGGMEEFRSQDILALPYTLMA